MNWVCIFSSFLFLTNALLNYYYKEFIYAGLFLGLFITSIIVHTNNTIYTNLFDKIFIASVVIYGGYIYFKKISQQQEHRWISILPFIFFILTIYLYIYGYLIKDYCFHKQEEIANNYHALMHLCGSIGHHFIVLL
jgi:hypothetical protein